MRPKVVWHLCFCLSSLLTLSAQAETLGSKALADNASTTHEKTCGDVMKSESSDKHEAACLAAAGALAARRNNILILKMDNGTTKSFKTLSDNENVAYGYALLDFIPKNRIFVVGNVGIDSQTVIAIEGRTGRIVNFGHGYPHYSPTASSIVVAVEHDPNSEEPSRFELLDAREKKPKTVWKGTAGQGRLPIGATFDTWISDDAVRMIGAKDASVIVSRTGNGGWSEAARP